MIRSMQICMIHHLLYQNSTSGEMLCRYGLRIWVCITREIGRFINISPPSCERTAYWGISQQSLKDYLQYTGTRCRIQRAPGRSRALELQRSSQGPGILGDLRRSGAWELLHRQWRNIPDPRQRLPRVLSRHVNQWNQRPLVWTFRTRDRLFPHLPLGSCSIYG